MANHYVPNFDATLPRSHRPALFLALARGDAAAFQGVDFVVHALHLFRLQVKRVLGREHARARPHACMDVTMRVQKPARAALNVIVRIVRFEARPRVGEGNVSPGDDFSRRVVEGGLVGCNLHRAVSHFHMAGEPIGILHLFLRIRENAHGVGRILESRRYRGLGLSSSCARRSSSRQGSHKKQHQAARPARPGFSRVPHQRLSGLHRLKTIILIERCFF